MIKGEIQYVQATKICHLEIDEDKEFKMMR